MSEEMFWLKLWGMLSAASVLLTVTLTIGTCHHRKTMIENGYEEVTLQGTSSICWQKVK